MPLKFASVNRRKKKSAIYPTPSFPLLLSFLCSSFPCIFFMRKSTGFTSNAAVLLWASLPVPACLYSTLHPLLKDILPADLPFGSHQGLCTLLVSTLKALEEQGKSRLEGFYDDSCCKLISHHTQARMVFCKCSKYSCFFFCGAAACNLKGVNWLASPSDQLGENQSNLSGFIRNEILSG